MHDQEKVPDALLTLFLLLFRKKKCPASGQQTRSGARILEEPNNAKRSDAAHAAFQGTEEGGTEEIFCHRKEVYQEKIPDALLTSLLFLFRKKKHPASGQQTRSGARILEEPNNAKRSDAAHAAFQGTLGGRTEEIFCQRKEETIRKKFLMSC